MMDRAFVFAQAGNIMSGPMTSCRHGQMTAGISDADGNDEYSRECLANEVDRHIRSGDVRMC